MPVNVGFIGVGSIAGAHIASLSQMEDVSIVAFTDVEIARARDAAAKHGGNAYADCREMYDSEKLDAVYICVPPHAHSGQEILAAERGIHLFVEKPVGLSLDEAKRTRKAIDRSGVISSVGYHWRYRLGSARAKELLATRDTGMVLGYWMGGFAEVAWWRRYGQSGGQMVEQMTHIVDLARYLCGEIKEIYAAYAVRALSEVPDLSISDVGTCTAKFEDGSVGSFSNTCILGIPYTVGLHVVCKDLVVEIAGETIIRQPGITETVTDLCSPHHSACEAFIVAVRTGNRSGIRSSYSDAVRTLAVTLAANESASTGVPVQVG